MEVEEERVVLLESQLGSEGGEGRSNKRQNEDYRGNEHIIII